jgi:hypothetical protein
MEIELYSRIQDPITACEKAGNFFAKSGMFGCDKPEQGFILALECFSTGKPPSVIARTYHIMDGKLSKKAMAGLAEFRGIGGKHKWIKDGTDGKEAILELTLEGNTIVSRFTIEEAKAQGLIRPRSNWEKTPANMLRARAMSNGVAMLAPEIYAGDSVDDELPQAEPKPLLRETAPTVSAAPKNEPVIDVAASAVAEPKAEAPATAAESPKPACSEADIELSPETQRLTVKAMAALEFVIGEANMPAAITWLKKQGWIQTTLSELSVERAKRLVKNPEKFLEHITKGAK